MMTVTMAAAAAPATIETTMDTIGSAAAAFDRRRTTCAATTQITIVGTKTHQFQVADIRPPPIPGGEYSPKFGPKEGFSFFGRQMAYCRSSQISPHHAAFVERHGQPASVGEPTCISWHPAGLPKSPLRQRR